MPNFAPKLSLRNTRVKLIDVLAQQKARDKDFALLVGQTNAIAALLTAGRVQRFKWLLFGVPKPKAQKGGAE